MGRILQPFNIMAKPVCGVCNLDCRYCYYTAKPRELYPGVEKFMMSDRVLESFVRQYLQAMPQQCEFGFQGGEPMLAGLDFYEKVVALQKQHRLDGQRINNAFQTNGTLLDEAWCEFLAREKILVGISIDGPPQWHDAFRKDHAGNPTFHRAWAGLELMAKHGVEFNVLVTLNSANAPHAGDIYRYFVNHGARYLQFIPVLERDADDQPTDFSCTGEQFGRFLLEVFEIWASRDVGKVSERFIDNVLHSIIYDRASMCCYAQRCANAFVLEFNGDLYACDHFVYPEWLIGNIMDRPLAELVCAEKVEQFASMKTDLPPACGDCEYLSFCNAGCPKHHSPIGTDPGRVNHFCQGYKLFFKEALPELRRIAEYIKQGQTPPPKESLGSEASQRGASQAPAVDAPMARGLGGGGPAGRNDPCPCGSGKKYKNCCGR